MFLKILVSAFLLFQSVPVFCQNHDSNTETKSKFQVNFTPGLDISKFAYKNFAINNGPYSNFRTAIILGGSIGYDLTNVFNLRIGLNWINSGGKSDDLIGADVNGNELGTYNIIQELIYYEIPIQIKAYLISKEAGLYVLPGISAGFISEAKWDIEKDFDADFSRLETDKKDDFKNHIWVLLLGAGYELPIAQKYLIGIEGTYGIGLNNIYNVEGSDAELRVREFRLNLLFSLSL